MQFTTFESQTNGQASTVIPQGLCALLASSQDSFLTHQQSQENRASVGLLGWGKPDSGSNGNGNGNINVRPLQKPKRVLNAYNLFFKYHKQLIQEDIRAGRQVGYGNLARDIASRWRSASLEEKAHFTYLYKLDKKRHEGEMKAWKEHKALLVKEQLREVKQQHQEQDRPVDIDPLPFDDYPIEVDSNPYLVDSVNMQRLAHNLGEECTMVFLRVFLN